MFRNFELQFTLQTWLQPASNLASTCFRQFPTLLSKLVNQADCPVERFLMETSNIVFQKLFEIWMAAHPTNMIPIGFKLGQNVFQAIPTADCSVEWFFMGTSNVVFQKNSKLRTAVHPVTFQTWLQSASNLAKTCFKQFPRQIAQLNAFSWRLRTSSFKNVSKLIMAADQNLLHRSSSWSQFDLSFQRSCLKNLSLLWSLFKDFLFSSLLSSLSCVFFLVQILLFSTSPPQQQRQQEPRRRQGGREREEQ